MRNKCYVNGFLAHCPLRITRGYRLSRSNDGQYGFHCTSVQASRHHKRHGAILVLVPTTASSPPSPRTGVRKGVPEEQAG